MLFITSMPTHIRSALFLLEVSAPDVLLTVINALSDVVRPYHHQFSVVAASIKLNYKKKCPLFVDNSVCKIWRFLPFPYKKRKTTMPTF